MQPPNILNKIGKDEKSNKRHCEIAESTTKYELLRAILLSKHFFEPNTHQSEDSILLSELKRSFRKSNHKKQSRDNGESRINWSSGEARLDRELTLYLKEVSEDDMKRGNLHRIKQEHETPRSVMGNLDNGSKQYRRS